MKLFVFLYSLHPATSPHLIDKYRIVIAPDQETAEKMVYDEQSFIPSGERPIPEKTKRIFSFDLDKPSVLMDINVLYDEMIKEYNSVRTMTNEYFNHHGKYPICRKDKR